MGRTRRRKRKAKLIYIRLVFLILMIIVTFSLIRSTRAKYKSSAQSDANVDLAFYLFKEESISQDLKLESILPRATPYNYTFSVANNDGTDRTETSIVYTMELKTTTNLPLEFHVYNQTDLTTDLVTQTETVQDEDGTYFKKIKVSGGEFGFLQNEQATYVIKVEFPERYNVSDYEGIIEYIQLTIKSSQKIS